jgi:exosortase
MCREDNTFAGVLLSPPKWLQWSIIGGLSTVLYWNVLSNWLLDLWDDPNYSHGLLIPFISLYYLKTKSSSFRGAVSKHSNSGILVIILSICLFIVGYMAGELFSKRVSFIILVYGITLYLEGPEKIKILRFPILILLFCVPLPYILYNAVAFPLKLIASQISVVLFKLLGMPVFREGNIISLSHTTLEVVDVCSGIRSLMTLITLAFLLAYFRHKRLWKRMLIIIMATPIAVLANSTRVTATGVLTRYNPAWGEGFLHELTGWLVFVLSLVLLIGISLIIQKKSHPTEDA